MKIAVLTSSRADYGIYLPLLKELHNDAFFDLRIIAFGTHLSAFHGHTIDAIKADGFTIDHCVEHILASDSANAIATSAALASQKFAEIWKRSDYDLVLCLGDRFEMFAAVSAGSPFRIPFAHFHGGETTLGAIDNEYRHCITLFSKLHFVATGEYAKRVEEIAGSNKNIHVIGSLSLENLLHLSLLNATQFKERFNIDMSAPSIVVTLHPETIEAGKSSSNAEAMMEALLGLKEYQLVITMPNADTKSISIRNVYEQYARQHKSIILVENLGTLGYFSALNLAKLVVGNSSSGIIEAASLKRYVVNIGDRQEGRTTSANVIHCGNNKDKILDACKKALQQGEYTGPNVYYRQNAVQQVIQVLKTWL